MNAHTENGGWEHSHPSPTPMPRPCNDSSRHRVFRYHTPCQLCQELSYLTLLKPRVKGRLLIVSILLISKPRLKEGKKLMLVTQHSYRATQKAYVGPGLNPSLWVHSLHACNHHTAPLSIPIWEYLLAEAKNYSPGKVTTWQSQENRKACPVQGPVQESGEEETLFEETERSLPTSRTKLTLPFTLSLFLMNEKHFWDTWDTVHSNCQPWCSQPADMENRSTASPSREGGPRVSSHDVGQSKRILLAAQDIPWSQNHQHRFPLHHYSEPTVSISLPPQNPITKEGQQKQNTNSILQRYNGFCWPPHAPCPTLLCPPDPTHHHMEGFSFHSATGLHHNLVSVLEGET